jgi:uncharacterized protein (TIGR02646 family)
MGILRGPDPGPFKKHGAYKPYLQPLFRERCAYCLAPDNRNGGLEGMTVDHFLDQKHHPELRLAWTNLYYSCVVCNSHYKKDYPTEDEEKAGFRFVDPCKEDPDDHFCMVRDPKTGELCQVRGLSAPAKYAIWRLHLNARRALRDFWRELEHLEIRELTRINEIDRLLGDLEAEAGRHGRSPAMKAICDDYALTRGAHTATLTLIRSLRPFPIGTG